MTRTEMPRDLGEYYRGWAAKAREIEKQCELEDIYEELRAKALARGVKVPEQPVGVQHLQHGPPAQETRPAADEARPARDEARPSTGEGPWSGGVRLA